MHEGTRIENLFACLRGSFGQLDIAVNNAGIAGERHSTGSYSIEGWRKVIDINLNAVIDSADYDWEGDRPLNRPLRERSAPPPGAVRPQRTPGRAAHPRLAQVPDPVSGRGDHFAADRRGDLTDRVGVRGVK
jgi:hypothetical protein